jgi:hypothetical protein
MVNKTAKSISSSKILGDQLGVRIKVLEDSSSHKDTTVWVSVECSLSFTKEALQIDD